MMIASPVLASGFVIDPANIFKVWYEANHWAEITGAGLFAAMIAATWKMPAITNETKAVMVSDLFKFGRYLVAILFIIGFWDFIVIGWIALREAGEAIINYIFG